MSKTMRITRMQSGSTYRDRANATISANWLRHSKMRIRWNWHWEPTAVQVGNGIFGRLRTHRLVLMATRNQYGTRRPGKLTARWLSTGVSITISATYSDATGQSLVRNSKARFTSMSAKLTTTF